MRFESSLNPKKDLTLVRHQNFRISQCKDDETAHFHDDRLLIIMGIHLTGKMAFTLKRASGILNTLRPRQNGRHFTDDIFKWIFLNENVYIPIKISLKFVPQGPINNIPELVQIMAWRRPGDKPLSGPMMVRLLTHICVTRPQWVKLMKYVCTVLECKHSVRVVLRFPVVPYLVAHGQTTWVGVTRAPFVDFSASKISNLAKVPLRF